ncbi:MAG: hypothetical protein ACI965_001775, partial [Paraglaciecola sp.]
MRRIGNLMVKISPVQLKQLLEAAIFVADQAMSK